MFFFTPVWPLNLLSLSLLIPLGYADVHLITEHINSVPRESFDNRTPFDLMVSPEQKKLLEFLKLSPIPLDDVLLKPTLLKKK